MTTRQGNKEGPVKDGWSPNSKMHREAPDSDGEKGGWDRDQQHLQLYLADFRDSRRKK